MPAEGSGVDPSDGRFATRFFATRLMRGVRCCIIGRACGSARAQRVRSKRQNPVEFDALWRGSSGGRSNSSCSRRRSVLSVVVAIVICSRSLSRSTIRSRSMRRSRSWIRSKRRTTKLMPNPLLGLYKKWSLSSNPLLLLLLLLLTARQQHQKNYPQHWRWCTMRVITILACTLLSPSVTVKGPWTASLNGLIMGL